MTCFLRCHGRAVRGWFAGALIALLVAMPGWAAGGQLVDPGDPNAIVREGPFVYAHRLNHLLRLERALLVLNQTESLDAVERRAKADHLQAEIAKAKAALQGRFAPADIELGRSLLRVRQYGAGWILCYLSEGRYTGSKKAVHRPLDPVTTMREAPAGAVGRATLPLQGPPLMILLSHDAVCREAFTEFSAGMVAIVREMEKRTGRPYEFFDKRPPAIIPNDLGWDIDRFWRFAHDCAGRAVERYFFDFPVPERGRATNLVALIIVSALMNNVTIDLDGEKASQIATAYWRSNAVPWLVPDKTIVTNKFRIWHSLTHAWCVYYRLLEATRWDRGVLAWNRAKPVTPGDVKAAIRWSWGFGTLYEVISALVRRHAGLLEPTAVEHLPTQLQKVARILHLKNVVGYESYGDVRDNNNLGDQFGAALFLSANPLQLSDFASHRRLVADWAKSRNEALDLADAAGSGAPPQMKVLARWLRDDRISLLDLNAPEGRRNIDAGRFAEVYRGMGAFDAKGAAAAEVEAFRYLLGENITSYNLRLLETTFASHEGGDRDRAAAAARRFHARMIAEHFADADEAGRQSIFHDLFSNDPASGRDDVYNHEADYVFATRRYDMAGCYGPVVVVIRERQPRGLDLNRIASAAGYYRMGRVLKNVIRGRWQVLLGDHQLDDEEYILPSYVPSADVAGFDVLDGPRAKVVRAKMSCAGKEFVLALKAPPLLRRYRRSMVGGYRVIDVFDRQGALIERLSEAPDRTPFEGTAARSGEKLPPEVRALWRASLQRGP